MQRDASLIEINQITQVVELRNKSVLEVGCGAGRITESLVKLSGEYTAIDTDEEAIWHARNSIPGATFIVCSGENVPFPEKQFDVVLFSLSLHHQNPEKALAEANRILKERGRIIILEPTPNGEVQRIFHIVDDETVKLEKVQKALRTTSLKEIGRRKFISEWLFDNFNELVTYNFGQDQDRNRDFIMKIKVIIGKKKRNSPIRLEDELMIVVFEGTT